ncbi:MAG: FAD-dependent oxidoreductase [Candidatus Binatia bacterium]
MVGETDSAPRHAAYDATIERIVEHAPDTRSIFLRLPPPQRLAFIPGQFISCLIPQDDGVAVRPYSIASNPEDADVLEICLNLVPGGFGSTYLFGLAIGARVRFTGPWGTFTLHRQPEAECVFVAEGTGIAPIRPMLRRALASGGRFPLRLHYAAPGAAHLLYADEFVQAARAHPRFTFAPAVGESLQEVVTRQYLAGDEDRTRHFYICGVGTIVPTLRDLLRGGGYERRAVQYEKW